LIQGKARNCAGFVVSAGWRSSVFWMASSLASQLPQGYLLNTYLVCDINHCGSWLASEEAGTGNKKARRRVIICGLLHIRAVA
jgi:hypothetical protein